MSCCLSAAFSASSRLLDLKTATIKFRASRSRATIAITVSQFFHPCNADEVFGTHNTKRPSRKLPPSSSMTASSARRTRSNSRSSRERRPLKKSGLYLLPVSHIDKKQCSPEEAQAVGDLVRAILAGDPTWIDREGQEKPVTLDDIVIITATMRRSSRFGSTFRARVSAPLTNSRARKPRSRSIRPQRRGTRIRPLGCSSSTASTGSTSRPRAPNAHQCGRRLNWRALLAANSRWPSRSLPRDSEGGWHGLRAP
jgi:hypothetical protein